MGGILFGFGERDANFWNSNIFTSKGEKNGLERTRKDWRPNWRLYVISDNNERTTTRVVMQTWGA